VVILHKGKVVAYDTVERLRELQASPSLEAVFSQLAISEDTAAIAEQVIAVMKAG
jgi:ABC-type Na+ transport system ATPase subunit NatA